MSISCNACRYLNKESAKVCIKCGAPISSGAPLSSTKPRPAEQRPSSNANGTSAATNSFGSVTPNNAARRPTPAPTPAPKPAPTPPPPPPPPVSYTKPQVDKAVIPAPVVKSSGTGRLIIVLVIAALLAGGGFLYFINGESASEVTAIPSSPVSPVTPTTSESTSTPAVAKKEAFILSIPSDFSVEAPSESRTILTSMLVDAMNPMKLAEAKGLLEQLTKPVSGDRKVARSLNERGLEFFNKENYLDAIEFFKQAISFDSADIEVRNNYVYALAKAKKTAEAEREAGILLTYAPGRSSGWANLGEIYADKGQATLAASALVVAFQFSSNKDKTLTYLKEKSAAADNPVFAESAQIALDKLANQ